MTTKKPETPTDFKNHAEIVYLTKTIVTSSQFLLSASDDSVVVDCSTGPVQSGKGKISVPIHTRIALPWDAVERLAHSLNSLLANQIQRIEQKRAVEGTMKHSGDAPTAALPSFKNAG